MLCFVLSKLYDKVFQLQHNIVLSMVNGRRSVVEGQWSKIEGHNRNLASSGPRPHVSGEICGAGWPGGRVTGISVFRDSGIPAPLPFPRLPSRPWRVSAPHSSLVTRHLSLVTARTSALGSPASSGPSPKDTKRTLQGHALRTAATKRGPDAETSFRTVQRGRAQLRPQQG